MMGCEYRNKELNNCYFIKNILMLTVIAFHSILYYTDIDFFVDKYAKNIYCFEYLAEWLGTFHVQTFTLISGYLFFYLKYEKNRYTSFSILLKNKIKRLIIPYYIVCFIWVIPIGKCLFNYSYDELFFKYILATSPNQLWFVWMLFDVFFMAGLCSDLLYKNSIKSALFLIIVLLCGLIGSKIAPNFFQIWSGTKFLMFFFIGFKIRQHGIDTFRILNNFKLILLHTTFFLLFLYIKNSEFIVFHYGQHIIRLLTQIIGSITAFFVLQEISNNIQWKNNTIIQKINTYSFVIYLFHQQFIYISILLFGNILPPYFGAIINFVFSMICSFIIAMVIDTYFVYKSFLGLK